REGGAQKEKVPANPFRALLESGKRNPAQEGKPQRKQPNDDRDAVELLIQVGPVIRDQVGILQFHVGVRRYKLLELRICGECPLNPVTVANHEKRYVGLNHQGRLAKGFGDDISQSRREPWTFAGKGKDKETVRL